MPEPPCFTPKRFRKIEETRNMGYWWGYVTTGTFKFWLWSLCHPGWRWD